VRGDDLRELQRVPLELAAFDVLVVERGLEVFERERVVEDVAGADAGLAQERRVCRRRRDRAVPVELLQLRKGEHDRTSRLGGLEGKGGFCRPHAWFAGGRIALRSLRLPRAA
jgi:hypothetical protein